ncbi:MAG: hypothetical protein R3F43_14840 [bacterium]
MANSLRLLKLPPPILDRLAAAEITAGHARAILTPPRARRSRWSWPAEAVEGGWSVQGQAAGPRPQAARDASPVDETPSVDEAPSPATRAVRGAAPRSARGASPTRPPGRPGSYRNRFHSLDELERLTSI